MRTTITLLGVLAATSAAAQPAETPTCRVVIARAPDDVRAAIEEWVGREPSCGVTIDVRAVPTEGGYYLIARDEDGRLHERIVPDAASAGVLVASWIASWEPVPPPEAEADAEPEPATVPLEVTEPAPPPSRGSHWVALDGMAGGGGEGGIVGLRGEIDVIAGRHWRLGVGGFLGGGAMTLNAMAANGTVQSQASTSDRQAFAYVTREIRLGPWRVRPMFGLGEMFTTAHITDNSYPPLVMTQDVGITSTFAELSLRIAHDIGDSWAIEGGVIVDVMPQNVVVVDPAAHQAGDVWAQSEPYFESLRREMAIGLAVGVRHRL